MNECVLLNVLARSALFHRSQWFPMNYDGGVATPPKLFPRTLHAGNDFFSPGTGERDLEPADTTLEHL